MIKKIIIYIGLQNWCFVMSLGLIIAAMPVFAIPDPIVKFELNDGNFKTYKIEEIDNIAISNKSDNYLMKIYYTNSLTAEFPAKNINLMLFGLNSSKERILSVYLTDRTNRYVLSEIDSICFISLSKFYITNIIPDSASIGDLIEINGIGFGTEQGASYVSFTGASDEGVRATDYLSWSDNNIKVKVPENASSGNLSVTVGNVKSNDLYFTLIIIIPDSIAICEQTWKIKNLDVVTYRNGDTIPEVKDAGEWANLKTGAWCYYNNDPSMGEIYGKLYNWYATADERGLAPEGWHVPSDAELTVLGNCLGGGSIAGGKLKSTGTIEGGNGIWYSPNEGATNESGFSGLPGGFRNNTGSFNNIGLNAILWSSNEFDDSRAWYRQLDYRNNFFGRNKNDKGYGYSVRCIKGEAIESGPILSDIQPNPAILGEEINLTGSGFGLIMDTSFVSFNNIRANQVMSWNDTSIYVLVPLSAVSGKVYVSVKGHKSNETQLSINSNEVKIGKQIWMTRNLDVVTYRNGDPIPEVTDSTEWINETSGARCDYNNTASMSETYGKLYNWYAVNDTRGLAPEGWHIPSNAEWSILTMFLNGDSIAGGKLKETGTAHWTDPNTGATNEYGFTALPGGIRDENGQFNYLGSHSEWWSSTEEVPSYPFYRYIYNSSSYLNSYSKNRLAGLSIRCIKDTGINSGPVITSINPDTSIVGDEIYITGTGFGLAQGGSFVAFNSILAVQYASWSDTLIGVQIPAGATTGKVTVTVKNHTSNELDLTINTNEVKTGGQIWMTRNLEVTAYRNGDIIPEVTDSTEWANLKTGASSYHNNHPALGTIYGKIYNWYAVNDARGLAPIGYHVPADNEWNELGNNFGGGSIAGGKLKSTGTLEDSTGLWNTPNRGATNESGFSGLPGGFRSQSSIFENVNAISKWWSATENDAIEVWYRQLYYNNSYLIRNKDDKASGFYIRCLRD